MSLKIFVVGKVETNCYVVINDDTKDCLIIDPGDVSHQMADFIRNEGLHVKAILVTHGHFDHILGIPKTEKMFSKDGSINKIPVYACLDEKQLLSDSSLNASAIYGRPVQLENCIWVTDRELLNLAGFHIEVIQTPGHTIGGVCYYLPYENMVFTGDTLFADEIGRTDLPTGNYKQLIQSIQEKLFILPEDVTVYPGHMDETTIRHEKQHNPYTKV